MPRRLLRHVHVRDESGVTHVFAPADEVPDWAAAKITNPKAWAPGPEAAENDGAPVPQQVLDGASSSTAASAGAPGSQQAPGPGASARPAESATKDVWLAYAAVRDLEVPEGATKAQIIEAVTAADEP